MSNAIDGLYNHFDHKVVDQLLTSYREAKREFYVGGKRLNAVEGGRFCEAAFRVLEQCVGSSFTPLGQQLNVDQLVKRLASAPVGTQPDSLRLHVPRALRVVYDIRNNRGAAHLSDGIDPNVQDATLVITCLDWVLAEFVRLYHDCSPEEAQSIINDLVTKKVPAVQEFEGFLKVLKPNLKVGEYVLLLLYERGSLGAKYEDIERWVKPSMRKNLRRSLYRLVHDNAYLHCDGSKYIITRSGTAEVERRRLHE